jgi:fatty acid CoA ligase FadD9
LSFKIGFQSFEAILRKKKDVPIVLIGCKSDLLATTKADLVLNVGPFVEEQKLIYKEWSSLSGDVDSIIQFLTSVVMENDRRETLPSPSKMYKGEANLVEGLTSKSVASGLRMIMNAYADRPALGERMLDKDGERMMRFKWTTYRELGNKIRNFGTGIKSLTPTRSLVCLCAENGVNWIAADLALQTQNMVGVTVHHTVPDEDIEYVVSNSQIDAAVSAPHRAKAFARAAASNPKLRFIIIQPTVKSERDGKIDIETLLKECREIAPSTRFLLHDEVEAIGSHLDDSIEECNDPDQLFTISYTSGSTGRPKGMMVSHKVYRSLIFDEQFGAYAYTIFMPLSHTSRLMAYAIMGGGGRTSLFTGEMSNLLEELQLAEPSEMIAVPRFWNIMYGEFNEVVSLYLKHLPEKGQPFAQHVARQLFESLLGGNLEVVAAGGAPSSPDVFDWLHGFSFPATETYGSTECGVFVLGHKIIPKTDYKLLDVPEMGYTTQDKPFPRGEVCAKTTNMFMGYHNNPEETKAAFTEDGYFKTGDIVQLEGPQFLRVIDRRKFIFKLSQGEYVSPAKSEGAYGKSPFISHIMAYGNSLRSYLVAVVVPNESHLMAWAESHGITGMNYQQLCQLADIKALLMNEIHACEMTSQLRAYEKVRNIFVTSENFTPDNGLLTATSKLNRTAILNKFRPQLDALYSSAPTTEESRQQAASSDNSEALLQLKAIVAGSLSRQVQDSSISNDMHLASSGLDSLAALRLVNTIKQKMNISLPIASLYQPGMTVQSLAQVVSATQNGTVPEESAAAAAQEQVNPMLDCSPYFWFPELMPSYEDAQKMLSDAHDKKKAKADAEKEKQKNKDNAVPEIPYTDPSTVPGSNLFTDIKYQNILLTGATGFLGLYLLADLLEAFPQANVHCLVRAASDEEAMKRMDETIEFAHLSVLYPEMRPGTPTYARIKAVAGDLAREDRFGMSQATWDHLCDTIDSIYHNGVWVNLLFPYQVLRSANVVSTVQLLKMAMTGAKNRKAFHYISTLSALAKSYVPTPIDKSTITADSDLFGYTGYPLTKRVSEVLISRVEELVPDLPIIVFRAGAIFAHSKTGHVNIIAFIHKLFCGMVQYGYYPQSKSQDFDWAPVDFYSKAITHIAKTGGTMTSPRRYNVSSPVYNAKPCHIDVLASYIRSAGYKLDPKPAHLWRNDIFQHFESHPGSNLLEPLKQLLSEGTPGGSFDLTTTLDALKGPDGKIVVECPPITEQHIHAVLKFCAEKGYIQQPHI